MDMKEIIKEENIVYKKSVVLTDKDTHYCPGCTHGVVHRIIAELIEEMGIQETTIGIAPWDAPFLHTIISISIGKRRHMDELRPWPLPLND